MVNLSKFASYKKLLSGVIIASLMWLIVSDEKSDGSI